MRGCENEQVKRKLVEAENSLNSIGVSSCSNLWCSVCQAINLATAQGLVQCDQC